MCVRHGVVKGEGYDGLGVVKETGAVILGVGGLVMVLLTRGVSSMRRHAHIVLFVSPGRKSRAHLPLARSSTQGLDDTASGGFLN